MTLKVDLHYTAFEESEIGSVSYELSLNDTKTYDEVSFSVRNDENEVCALDSAKFVG